MASLRARIKPGAGYWQRTGPNYPHPSRHGSRWDRFPHEDCQVYYGPVLILVDLDPLKAVEGDQPFETLHPVPGIKGVPPARVTGWIRPDLYEEVRPTNGNQPG